MKNCTLRKIAALLTILTVGLTLMLTGYAERGGPASPVEM